MVGVSNDSQQRNDEFARSLELPYPLVGDAEGRIIDAYKAKWPVLGMARRVSYVIGRDGRVREAHRSELDADSHVSHACSVLSAPDS